MGPRVTIEPQNPGEVRSGELHGAAARAVLVKVEIGAWGWNQVDQDAEAIDGRRGKRRRTPVECG